MTLVLAWLTPKGAAIVADTIMSVATEVRAAGSLESSVFGENLSLGEGLHTRDTLLKVHRFAGCAVAYSGSVGIARSFLDVFSQACRQGELPSVAFARAATSVTPLSLPFSAVVIWSGKTPGLRTFNLNGDLSLADAEPGTMFMLGSATPEQKQAIHHYILTLNQTIGLENYPSATLACVLAFMQAFSGSVPTILSGYGAAYVGVSADAVGVSQMPDMFYILLESPHSMTPGDGVSVRSRFDTIEVRSAARRYLLCATPCESLPTPPNGRRSKAIIRAFDEAVSCAPEYVAFICPSGVLFTVVQMEGNWESSYLKLQAPPWSGHGLGCEILGEVLNSLLPLGPAPDGPGALPIKFSFFPYHPPMHVPETEPIHD